MGKKGGPRVESVYVLASPGTSGRYWYVGRGTTEEGPILPVRSLVEAMPFRSKADLGEWLGSLPEHVRASLGTYRLGLATVIPERLDAVPVLERFERGKLK